MTWQEYLTKSQQREWQFNTVCEPFLNIRHIHPIKQSAVLQIVRYAKNNPAIREIVIFGSSVTVNCHALSDLDICMDWNLDSIVDEEGIFVREVHDALKNISTILDYNCDIVHRCYLQSPLKEEIESKGVVVYVSDD